MFKCKGFNREDDPFIYYDNENSFRTLENYFESKYSIPKNILQDTIIRELVSSSNKKVSLLKYYGFIFILLVSTIFYKKKKKHKGDILFDNFTITAYNRFYKHIYENLENKKMSYLSSEISEQYPTDISFVKTNKLYERKISFKIIFNELFGYFKYKSMSKKFGIDYLYISTKILYWLAKYKTDIDNVNYKLLISNGDNYYNAIRYYIYKQSAIKQIFLFQNGTRGANIHNISKDYCVYSDYYFAHGTKSILLQKGMNAKKKIPFGSISLLPYLKSKQKELKYDIVFLEQMTPHRDKLFEGKEVKNATFENYMLILEHLAKFSNEFPNLKILYRVISVKRDVYPDLVKEIDERLKNSNVIIDEHIHNNSHEAIINSNVCLIYSSTVGFEALGLGKKVLFFNYNNLDFVLSKKDEIGVVIEKSYETFKKKVLYVTNNDNHKIQDYYNQRKKIFMNTRSYSNKLLNKLIKYYT